MRFLYILGMILVPFIAFQPMLQPLSTLELVVSQVLAWTMVYVMFQIIGMMGDFKRYPHRALTVADLVHKHNGGYAPRTSHSF